MNLSRVLEKYLVHPPFFPPQFQVERVSIRCVTRMYYPIDKKKEKKERKRTSSQEDHDPKWRRSLGSRFNPFNRKIPAGNGARRNKSPTVIRFALSFHAIRTYPPVRRIQPRNRTKITLSLRASPLVYGLEGEFNDALVHLSLSSLHLASHQSVGREIGRKKETRNVYRVTDIRVPFSSSFSYPFPKGWKESREEEEEEGLSLTRVYSSPEMELDF